MQKHPKGKQKPKIDWQTHHRKGLMCALKSTKVF